MSSSSRSHHGAWRGYAPAWAVEARGFSLVELLVVVAVIGTLAGIAIPISNGFIKRTQADSASLAARTVIESARNRAIAERRNFELHFVTPNRVTIERMEVPGPATTVVDDRVLDNDQTFMNFTGVPDTPDAFGAAAAIQFGGTAPVMFTSDGSLVDADGDVVNGTVFMGRTGEIETARAITIFGVTGLIRTWKWSGSGWVQ